MAPRFKLEGQPFQILALLLSGPGECDKRGIGTRLWAPGTSLTSNNSITRQ